MKSKNFSPKIKDYTSNIETQREMDDCFFNSFLDNREDINKEERDYAGPRKNGQQLIKEKWAHPC